MEEILNRLLDYSYYAYERAGRGYITIEGGHRVGICGRVTLENGQVHLIKDISSLNIRRSREIPGISDKILGAVLSPAKAPAEVFQNAGVSADIRDDRSPGTLDISGACSSAASCGSTAPSAITSKNMADISEMIVRNTLIISPPKCGKTTILRDLARSLSYRGFRIGICDERSEIAGCYDGKTSYDLGPRTDVLDGCPKAEGILMLIRAMSPDVVLTDEIGKPEDAAAIRSALSAGVKIITTIHGSSFEDAAKSAVGDLITDHVFETLIFLSAQPVTGTVEKILRLPVAGSAPTDLSNPCFDQPASSQEEAGSTRAAFVNADSEKSQSRQAAERMADSTQETALQTDNIPDEARQAFAPNAAAQHRTPMPNTDLPEVSHG